VAFEEGGDLSAVFGELIDVGEAGVGIEEDFAEDIRAFSEDALAEDLGGDGVGFGWGGKGGCGWGWGFGRGGWSNGGGEGFG
jgi:hypothetical protein